MSYDISISLNKTDSSDTISNQINNFENVENLRFFKDDNFYMEIDLENTKSEEKEYVNQILFHIPYSYLEKTNTDFDLYFELIKEIAFKIKGTTKDLQLDTSLDSEKFDLDKPHLIQNAVQLSKISITGNQLSIHGAYRQVQYSWDLGSGNYIGREHTEKQITNYECYNNIAENGLWKVESDKKTLIVFNKKNNFSTVIKRTGEVVRMILAKNNNLFTASSNKSIKLWDLKTGKALRTFKGHSDLISDIVLFNNETLISSSVDGSIRFWNIETGDLLFLILHSYYSDSWIMISSNGDYHCSNNYKGSIRWGFGKEVYQISRGYGFDSKGSWNYTFDESSRGVKTKNLILKMLNKNR